MKTAIYICDTTNINQINKAIELYNDTDIFMALEGQCRDKSLPIGNFAAINFYHLYYAQDLQLMFLDYKDYNNKADSIKCPKILVVEKSDLMKVNKLKDTSVIISEKNKLRKAKNAELQPLFG